MKKSNLIKLFSILTISIMVIMLNTNVFAANDNGFNDLTGTLGTNNTNANTNTNINANANANINTNTNMNANANANLNTNTNMNVNTNTNANSNVNANNTSIYNTNLPKTGMEDSIPIAMLVVIFGISAVYAYKKVRTYRDI